jgi:hypothetical protein
LNVKAELSSVCAIIGGILAQDILNTLSQRELPINNFFVYDGFEGKYFQISVFVKKKFINLIHICRFWTDISSTTRKENSLMIAIEKNISFKEKSSEFIKY